MSNSVNPFAALLDCGGFSEDSPALATTDRIVATSIEEIFGFTLNKHKGNLVYLEDLAKTFPSEDINVEVLEHALFERILLPNPQDYVQSAGLAEICDTKVISYLVTCFKKTDALGDGEFKSSVTELILRNVVTALKQPELYEGQDLHAQLYEILKADDAVSNLFFVKIYKRFLEDEDGLDAMKEPFTMLLKMVHVDTARASPVAFPSVVFNVLNIYCMHEELALILLDYCKPKKSDSGVEYANTLLGALFAVSVLPKVANGSFEFFQDPLDQASNSGLESILWTNSNRISQDIHSLILNLLKCSQEVRARTLTWLGNCLKANIDRGKLWNAQAPEFNPTNFTSVSDGFMINFAMVMTRLCQPFCSNIDDGKVLKVDPTYCAVPNDDCNRKGIHLLDMAKETCLVPAESDDGSEQARPTSPHYNFVTECFFMGHRAFDLSFRVSADKLVRLNQILTLVLPSMTTGLDSSCSDIAMDMPSTSAGPSSDDIPMDMRAIGVGSISSDIVIGTYDEELWIAAMVSL